MIAAIAFTGLACVCVGLMAVYKAMEDYKKGDIEVTLVSQDRKITILHADVSKLNHKAHCVDEELLSKLHKNTSLEVGDILGENLYYEGTLIGTFDDAEEAEEAVLAIKMLGKHLQSVAVPGYSNTNELHHAGW